ncbi:hypothetical protein C8R44DRAFT_989689 [Mycena epipterygia]|nr:hypothetical protein C8R44DRAFT_989689 [Mycena epipterygia]
MSAASQENLEAELFQLIADAQTTNYLAVASLTLAVIDLIANLKDEYELIWKGRLRISNGIYIWMRYFSLITVSIYASFMLREIKSDNSCQSFLLAEAVTSSLIGMTSDLILVLRVWVLYGKSRILLYFLLPLVVVEVIVMITVGVFTILPLGEYFHIGPIILGCYSLNVPRYFKFYAVPFSFTSFLMFCMTLYKCGRTLLDHRAVRMPLITLFLRDGVFWFLTIFGDLSSIYVAQSDINAFDGYAAVSMAELLLWARGRPSLAQAMVAWATLLRIHSPLTIIPYVQSRDNLERRNWDAYPTKSEAAHHCGFGIWRHNRANDGTRVHTPGPEAAAPSESAVVLAH